MARNNNIADPEWVLKIPTIQYSEWLKHKLGMYESVSWSPLFGILYICSPLLMIVLPGLKAEATRNGRTNEWVSAWQLNLQLKWNTISRKTILDRDLFCYIVKTCYEFVEPNHFNDLLTFAVPERKKYSSYNSWSTRLILLWWSEV